MTIKSIIRSMNIGDKKYFPINSLETIRNNVSILNCQHFLDGNKWKSRSIKSEGLVEVVRIK